MQRVEIGAGHDVTWESAGSGKVLELEREGSAFPIPFWSHFSSLGFFFFS